MGLVADEVPPSPKFQALVVMVLAIALDVSVNDTGTPGHTGDGAAIKPAIAFVTLTESLPNT